LRKIPKDKIHEMNSKLIEDASKFEKVISEVIIAYVESSNKFIEDNKG